MKWVMQNSNSYYEIYFVIPSEVDHVSPKALAVAQESYTTKAAQLRKISPLRSR